jgi:ABC-type multidrug transport system fused ATPase/permease subunit
MEMSEIDKFGKNHLVHTVNMSTESAKNLVSTTISSFVDVAATLLVGLTMALAFCWQITLIAFLLIPLVAVAGMIQNKFLTQIG